MKIIDYFNSENKEHWLEQINNCDWEAGKYLYQLVKADRLKQLVGENLRLLMITDGDNLVGFCTLAEKDDVQPTSLTPWIGWVYTFPAYRGRRCAGKLLNYAEKLARNDGFENVYVSTNHAGLYEKYGYKFLCESNDINGEKTRIYARNLSGQIKGEEDMWKKLYEAAVKVQNGRTISPFIEAGGVAAAILTKNGNIYVGVCIDTCSSLGMCAERNAIANMITNGESRIDKVVAVMPDGRVGSPCGACREYMMQLDKDSGEIEILLDLETERTIRLKELVPDWWGRERFGK